MRIALKLQEGKKKKTLQCMRACYLGENELLSGLEKEFGILLFLHHKICAIKNDFRVWRLGPTATDSELCVSVRMYLPRQVSVTWPIKRKAEGAHYH